MLEGWGGRVEGEKGGKWKNYNSIINKKYLKKEFGVLSLCSGSLEHVSAVNAAMRLFRCMDFSYLLKVIPLLRNIQG